MSDEPKLKITAPDAGTFKVAEPYLVESVPLCRIETWSDGTKQYKTEHEPDEELEQELAENHKKYMEQHGITPQPRLADGPFISWHIDGNTETCKKAVVAHVCKHCRCFYAVVVERKDGEETA